MTRFDFSSRPISFSHRRASAMRQTTMTTVAMLVVGLVQTSCATTPTVEIAPEDEPVKAIVVACEENIVVACMDLADRASRGDGVKKDPARAQSLVEKSCTLGHAAACQQLADHHANAGAPNVATLGFLEKACEEDDARACVRASLIALQQEKPDFEKVNRSLRIACDESVAEGCTALGVLASEGRGQPRADDVARTMFEKGCKLGDAQACANLASMLDSGRGAMPDHERAAQLYEAACDADVASACFNRAVQHRRTAAPESEARAAALFEKACGLDEGAGCKEAALHHARGIGVVRDPVRARAFAERGCLLKSEQACAVKDSVDTDPAMAP